MSNKLVIMRGLPSAGKSTRAKELVALNGGVGVVYSTDEFWYKVVKPDKPEEYNFELRRLGEAHKWNLLRAQKAIEEGLPLIIIDNTNTTPAEPKLYVDYAIPQGYEVAIEEPTSPQWLEIKPLLSNKKENKKALKKCAVTLAEISTKTHNVPAWAIERMMWRWKNYTVADITGENS